MCTGVSVGQQAVVNPSWSQDGITGCDDEKGDGPAGLRVECSLCGEVAHPIR
jgi:hypothetical protein